MCKYFICLYIRKDKDIRTCNLTMDAYAYSKSLTKQEDPRDVLEKRTEFVDDINGGSYSGYIRFTTDALAQNGRWIDYSEAEIQIPYIVSLKSSADITAAAVVNSYLIALKNGSHQIIDGLSVRCQGTEIIQNIPLSNLYVSYKLMNEELNQSDLDRSAANILFYPDSPAYRFNAAADPNGDGYTNNRNDPSFIIDFENTTDQCNTGFLKRARMIGYDLRTAAANPQGVPTVRTVSQANRVQKNYLTDNDGGAAARIYYWNILACIKLKHLNSFFKNIPLTKGLKLDFQIAYNAYTFEINSDATDIKFQNTIRRYGNTNPVLVGSGLAANSAADYRAIAGTGTFHTDVVKTLHGVQNDLISICRLYAPSYILSPEAQDRLLRSPQHTVQYVDIQSDILRNVGVNSTFNQILHAGIREPKKLILCPFANTSAGVFVDASSQGRPVFESPFDSAPATCTPYASLSAIQCFVGGKALFDRALNYNFEIFTNEVLRASKHGAACDGENTGLVNYYNWESAYNWYVFDLSRYPHSMDNVKRSLEIRGTNNSGIALDLYAFWEYGRAITIDIAKGNISAAQ